MSIETNGRVSERPPRADVYLTQNFVMVELEVPGFTADELVLAASDRVVTVSGHRSRRTGDPHYLLHERGPDGFRRVFHLPAGSDGAHLGAQLADGVLVIRAPRVAWARHPAVAVAPTYLEANSNGAID